MTKIPLVLKMTKISFYTKNPLIPNQIHIQAIKHI